MKSDIEQCSQCNTSADIVANCEHIGYKYELIQFKRLICHHIFHEESSGQVDY